MKQPSASELIAVSRKLASYMAKSDGLASIKTQQTAYNQYRSALARLESKYSHFDFQDPRVTSYLESTARKILASKVIKGPGSEF